MSRSDTGAPTPPARPRPAGRGSPRRAHRRAVDDDGASGLVAIQLELARRRARDLRRQLGRLAAGPAEDLHARAVALRAGIERRLAEQLAVSLDRIGIPSRESITALEAGIARVGARLEKLEARAGERRGAARASPTRVR